MARFVSEVMNSELLGLSPEEGVQDAAHLILDMGITGAPVVDGGGRALGMVSLRDLIRPGPARTVSGVMTSPIETIGPDVTLEEAGRILSDTGRHRLVVADEENRVLGMLSSLDLIRGLLGLPAGHPQGFSHFDAYTELVWTDDTALDEAHLTVAPEGPGVFQLVHGPAGVPDQPVWIEAAFNVRSRLVDLITAPDMQGRSLMQLLDLDGLRFRAARCEDPHHRERAVALLRAEMRHGPIPSSVASAG